MGVYGIFGAVIADLESSLSQVRSVWTDQTAQTYDCINENMLQLAQLVWEGRERASAGEQAVKENYDEGEYDSILYNLGSRINSL